MSTVVRTMNAEGLVGTFPELIDATVDTIRLARGRLTARGALVLAREIYSCALNECKDEISVAVGVTTVLQGLGGFNATICLAMAKEGEEGGNAIFKMFRVFRLFRVLRVARILYRNENLKRVLVTVFGSGEALANLVTFILFAVLLFAVLGMHLGV